MAFRDHLFIFKRLRFANLFYKGVIIFVWDQHAEDERLKHIDKFENVGDIYV